MSHKIPLVCLVFVAASLWAQVATVLPADRFAFAGRLAKMGMHAEAAREYETLRGEKSLPGDEVLYRLAEAYRNAKRTQEANAAYARLLKDFPASRFVDYARLNTALLKEGAAREAELARLDHPQAPERIRASALYWLGQGAEARQDASAAVAYYQRAAAVSATNDVARFARLRAAGLQAASADAAERQKALFAYLDLMMVDDKALAAEANFFAAMLAYREGRHENATHLFRQLSERYPDSARVHESRVYAAWSSYLSGRYSEALALATPLRADGNEDAHYLVAVSLKALERRADALEAYAALQQAFPAGRYAGAAWFDRISILAAEGRQQAVLEALKERSEPPAELAERAWAMGCEAAITVTNLAQAVEYARLIARRPESPLAPNATHRLAWLLEKTGDHARSAVAYRALADRWPKGPLAAQGLYQAGVAERQMGRAEQACADWTRLLANYPDSPFAAEALYARAMEEIRRREYRAAERSLNELLARFPQTKKRPEALYWQGVSAHACGDLAEAERLLRAALAAQPLAEFRREIQLELAGVLQKKGVHAEAARLYSELLATRVVTRLEPARLAWIAEQLLAAGEPKPALAAAEILAARKADAAWNQIAAALEGAAHEAQGEQDAAASAYRRALEGEARTPEAARAALALGRLETVQGRFDEAKTHLSEVVARTQAADLESLRVQAYAALAHNEEERGDRAAALGYHLLVGTLFDDPVATPHALVRAVKLMREQGQAQQAAELAAELARHYPKAKVD